MLTLVWGYTSEGFYYVRNDTIMRVFDNPPYGFTDYYWNGVFWARIRSYDLFRVY